MIFEKVKRSSVGSSASNNTGSLLRLRAQRLVVYVINLRQVTSLPLRHPCQPLHQLSDNKDADVTLALRTFREGDRVRAYIISRDLEKRQLSLGLKPSYFTGDDDGVEPDSQDSQDDKLGNTNDVKILGVLHGSDSEKENPDDSGSDGEEGLESDNDDDVGDRDDINMQIDLAPPGPTDSPKPLERQDIHAPLKLDGFQWFARPEEPRLRQESPDESSSEEDSNEKKRKRRKEIEMDVTADMQTKLPDSNADFERMLLGSPNSSYLWIQYMSFQLQLSEIDKARAIGKRAIQTIHFREEQEKLNVWIALLNLENSYGTDATMEAVFNDAARHNDTKTIHLRLAAIFDESQKYEVFSNALLIGTLARKVDRKRKSNTSEHAKSLDKAQRFGHYSANIIFDEGRWKTHASFCRVLCKVSRNGNVSGQHFACVLGEHLHLSDLKTISKFAQIEYKLGDPERGRTIFEGIVDSHPKRWDIWSVYMDMETRKGDIQQLRYVLVSRP